MRTWRTTTRMGMLWKWIMLEIMVGQIRSFDLCFLVEIPLGRQRDGGENTICRFRCWRA